MKKTYELDDQQVYEIYYSLLFAYDNMVDDLKEYENEKSFNHLTSVLKKRMKCIEKLMKYFEPQLND